MTTLRPVDPDSLKTTLRRRIHVLRNKLDARQRSSAETSIAEHLLAIPELRAATTVLSYTPIRGEVDISPAITHLREDGVTIALPRVEDNGALSARIHFVGQPLVPGAFGVPEPTSDSIGWDRVDAALVPGLAFDRQGNRLGYGGGFFDRALANYAGLKIGIAFECQLLDHVPAEPHDIAMDLVVTESGVLRA